MVWRFAFIYILVLFCFVLVFLKIIVIQQHERDNWLLLSDSLQKKDLKVSIEPNRGNIYSDEGFLMASSLPTHTLYIYFDTPALRLKDGEKFFKNIDSLAYGLSVVLKDKSAEEYKKYLIKGYRAKKTRYPITQRVVSHTEYRQIKELPLFREGKLKSGLVAEERYNRVKPYGSLASVTIGNLYGQRKEARQGIEKAFDTYLKGVPGEGHYVKRAGAPILKSHKERINGADITTTINVEMQDVAEKALLKKMRETEAEIGCVVIMETSTGQIKSCVNLKRNDLGDYSENENFTLRSDLEPGSTFKVPAMMALLEEGLVKATDEVDCGNGIWKFNEKVEISDHNTGEKANGVITMDQAIVRSSNVAMAKMVYQNYKENPQKYVERLKKMGVGASFDLGFQGVAQARIWGPKDNPKWAPSDLASMAYGYTVNMPILHTLTFFNAIANDGKMVAPYFVKEISREGEMLKSFSPTIMKNQICSPSTLSTIKSMMLQVVEDKEHGTGRIVKSDYVRIAGKTGTARYGYSRESKAYRHQVSFCGFFPYESPQYTCIVFIRNPSRGIVSGGGMAGTVFREIAERVMALNSYMPIEKYVGDSLRSKFPSKIAGNIQDVEKVFKQIDLDYKKEKRQQEWVVAKIDSMGVFRLGMIEQKENMMPNVVGMGLKDAVYLVEKLGLKVQVKGRGKVQTQSLKAGSQVQRGRMVELVLK